MGDGDFHCANPYCPICGGMSTKIKKVGDLDYLDKFRDLDALPPTDPLKPLLPNLPDDGGCTCASGITHRCPVHGLRSA